MEQRILIVEDEPAISDICRRVLTKEGFEVDIAANGKMAQNMIKKKQYDACLIDIRTPAMSGKDLYGWIQDKLPALAGRVIFTTGDVMGGDTQSFLEQSGRPFLPKPFNTEEIKDTMRETLKETDKWRKNR